MGNIVNFYDNMDLTYPEIGIAIDQINRKNPGNVRIIIPVLTPMMDNSKNINKIIYQSTYNLKNSNRNVEIGNIQVCNYIEIPFPKEICYSPDTSDDIIQPGSKWLIVFVGGDITKPRPIARYIE